MQFTGSAELRKKLERLSALMRRSVPDGDLGTIIDAASSRHVPPAVRRAVHARDAGRCAYRDTKGRRCSARVMLELHHRHPYGYGGDHSVGNVALLCHAHNCFLEEIDYGNRSGSRSGSS